MERAETSFLGRSGNRYGTKTGKRRQAATRQKKFSLKKFVKSPKGIVFFILAGFVCIGSTALTGSNGFFNVLLAVLTGVIFDAAVSWFMERPVRFSDGALITGMIVGGVLSPAVPWYLVMFTTVVALLSKHMLKNKRKPLFNPAAVGLFIGATLFAAGESWWIGLSMNPAWMTVFLLAGGWLIADRINKMPLVFAFLGTYMLIFLLMGLIGVSGAGEGLRAPYISAALFLAFFMLTDPPTSAARYRDQIYSGILAALVCGAAYLYLNRLTYLLVGLLVANGWNAIAATYHRRARAREAAAR